MTQTWSEILGKLTTGLLRIMVFTCMLVLVSKAVFSQKNILKNTRISTSNGIIVSSNGNTPILLRNLQYGTVPEKSQIAFLSGSIKRDYDSLYFASKKLKSYGWGYEIEPHLNLGNVNQILLPQAYAKIRFKALEFYAGRKKEIQGLVDTSGTMGSYIWSGNALPLPKLDISIPKFTSITRNGLIAIKGNYAHGWFGDGDSVKNYFLHQKSFYGRLGKPNWKIKIIAGFNHQVQWGGRPTVPYIDKRSNNLVTTFGNDFPTYIKAVTGFAVNRNQDGLNSGINSNDALNRIGNHLGTVDIGAEITTSIGEIKLYRQSIYEDGSLFYLSNISDGLNGISIKFKNNKVFERFTFEYFDTRNQGGDYFINVPAELRGQDNYFNNSIYKDGWRYRNQNLGSPLLISESDQILITNKKNQNYFVNSKVKVINLKLSYIFSKLLFSTQLLHSNNRGIIEFPINDLQFNFKQDCVWKYKSFLMRSIVSADIGKYWSQQAGLQFQIQKLW